MPFSSGTFSLFTPGNPVVTGTVISSTAHNNTLTDIATGLTTCVLKDGTQTVTANLPMATFKFTGLGAGTAANDSTRLAQVQAGAYGYLTTVAGTNTVTALATPTISAYATGMSFFLIPANTNTAATTLNVDSVSAANVFYEGLACVGGEFRAGIPIEVIYDGTQWNIIGPSRDIRATWSPVLTFATPGDLSVAYTTSNGRRTKFANIIRATFAIVTSTFTHTTASGELRITGLATAAANVTGLENNGAVAWQGITKANYTQVSARVEANSSIITFTASGSAQNVSSVAATDMPTGGTVILRGTILYQTDT